MDWWSWIVVTLLFSICVGLCLRQTSFPARAALGVLLLVTFGLMWSLTR